MCDKRRCSALCLGLWPHRMKFQTNNLEQILHWGRRTDGPTVWSTSAVQFVRSITSSLSRRRRRVVLPISEFHSSCRGNISCVKKHRNSDVTAKCNPKNATQVTVLPEHCIGRRISPISRCRTITVAVTRYLSSTSSSGRRTNQCHREGEI